MENKGESLPSPISSSSSGKKSTRKEEQYRLMFSELEKYVVAHSSNSSKHYSVLECLMQVRRFISIIKKHLRKLLIVQLSVSILNNDFLSIR